MKISLALIAIASLSSAGLYGTGWIDIGSDASMFEAAMAGENQSSAIYPMTLDNTFSKLISTPVIDEIKRGQTRDFAPQIIISVQNNRQINWKISIENEHVADIIVNLKPEDGDWTRVTLAVNIAENSILAAAATNSDSDIYELEQLSKLMIAKLIDHRLTGEPMDESKLSSAYSESDAKDLKLKLLVIERVIDARFRLSQPQTEYADLLEEYDNVGDDHTSESVTAPTDPDIGEVDDDLPGHEDVDEIVRASERAASRAAERAGAAAEAAGNAAAAAAGAARDAKSHN